MKKYLLSCIAFSVLLFTPNSPEGTRAIGYKGNENADPTKSHGYPIPLGIFDQRGIDGKEIADGTEVPVVCIFKSTDKDQPVTRVVTKWTYKKGGNLRLAPTSTFEMEAGTDLTKGTWYVCGILGGEQLLKIAEPQVKFNGYSEGHTTISQAGKEVTWGADIPYLFGWRKLEANAAKKSFKADKAVLFKQFGTIVRLRVESISNTMVFVSSQVTFFVDNLTLRFSIRNIMISLLAILRTHKIATLQVHHQNLSKRHSKCSSSTNVL